VLPASTAEEAPTENTPLRQPPNTWTRPPQPLRQLSRQQSRQQAGEPSQDEVARQLVEEVTGFLQRNFCYVLTMSILFLTLWIITLVSFVLAIIASYHHFHGKCDQPLNFYIIISLVWGQVPQCLHTSLRPHCSMIENHPVTSTLAFSSLGLVRIFWGVYMVSACKTCHETNPGLYYPIARYITCQVVFVLVLLVYAVIVSRGMRSALLLVNQLIDRPGCEAAVHEFPKVQAGDAELISPEDGQVLACPICMDELAGAVRTPCSHYFHEACLATWCQNHLTCPMCRERLAEPDKS